MDVLETIGKLCEVINLQTEIIEEQAAALAQMNAVCSEEKRTRAAELAEYLQLREQEEA